MTHWLPAPNFLPGTDRCSESAGPDHCSLVPDHCSLARRSICYGLVEPFLQLNLSSWSYRVAVLSSVITPSLKLPAVPSTGVRPRDGDVNWGCSLVLDDAPLLCVPIDIISLSNVEDAPINIPSDIGLVGESDNAFLLFSCLGLGVKSIPSAPAPDRHNQNTIHHFGITPCVNRTLS